MISYGLTVAIRHISLEYILVHRATTDGLCHLPFLYQLRNNFCSVFAHELRLTSARLTIVSWRTLCLCVEQKTLHSRCYLRAGTIDSSLLDQQVGVRRLLISTLSRLGIGSRVWRTWMT